MNIRCHPGPLRGDIRAIPSKSDAHRLLICAALADGPTTLRLPRWQGEDIAHPTLSDGVGGFLCPTGGRHFRYPHH